jgi:hypothetical protein
MSFGQLQMCGGIALLESNAVAQTTLLVYRWTQVEQVFLSICPLHEKINAVWHNVRNESLWRGKPISVPI